MRDRVHQASSSCRSAQSKARRRAIQRAHQRETWARRQRVEDDILRELQVLEDQGIRDHAAWAAGQLASLSDGTSAPQFAMWTTPYGPPTRQQAQLQQVLQEATEGLIRSPAGPRIKQWVDSPVEQEAATKEFWESLEPFLLEAGDKLATRWASLLQASDRTALAGGTLRPPLIAAMASAMQPNGTEDTNILSSVDKGVNIGVNNVLDNSGIWPAYSPQNVKYYETVRFACDSFRNYSSATDNANVVQDILDNEVALGRMRTVDPNDIEEGAIVSKIAAIEKPSSTGGASKWRIIDDMRRSGLNNLIRPNLPETLSLPNAVSLARLMKLAINASGAKDARFIILDARAAYRHIHVAAEDEKYLYNMAPLRSCLYRHTSLPFGMVSSPIIWTRTYGVIVRCIRRLVLRQSILYVDDTTWVSSKESALEDFIKICLCSLAFGIRPEFAKARVSDSPQVLGLSCLLKQGTISIPANKKQQTSDLLVAILSSAHRGRPVLAT